MNADRPFALHITWTTYGTWLPGDARGYVANTLRPDGYEPRHNMPQTPYTANEPATRQRAQGLQKWPTVWLDACQARCVAEALVTAARKRGWRIYRAAVMANHVHVVIADCPNDGPLVRRILKGSSQAALSEALGRPHRWWTENGSDHYKNDWPAIDNADQYVARQQGILAEVVDMAVRVPQGGGRDKPGRS